MSSTSTPASRERSASPGRRPAPPASAYIHLESIKPVSQLYQEKVLKEAEGDKVKRPANGSYLERVSLLLVSELVPSSMMIMTDGSSDVLS